MSVETPSAGLPGPLAPAKVFRFSSGPMLYGEFFPAGEPRASALVVHGYAEHCGRYREVAHVLVRAGVSVLAYDMRGHGRAEGQRGHVDRFEDYLDDLDAALEELHGCLGEVSEAHRAAPRFLLGHSNGALAVLRALADPMRRPAGIAAAVLSSPFLRLRAKVSPVKHLVGLAAGRWAPRLSLPLGLELEHLTKDPAKLAERRMDTLCNDVASARWYTEAQVAQEYVADYAARVDVPTTWLVAGDDRLTDPAAARIVRARLRVPSTYHGLEGFEHEVFNELERGRAFGLLTGFVEATF